MNEWDNKNSIVTETDHFLTKTWWCDTHHDFFKVYGNPRGVTIFYDYVFFGGPPHKGVNKVLRNGNKNFTNY